MKNHAEMCMSVQYLTEWNHTKVYIYSNEFEDAIGGNNDR